MIRSLPLLAALGLWCAAAPAAAAHPSDPAINAVYARLAESRAANDVAGMAGAFEPGALLIDARAGPAVSGAELAGILAPQRDRLVRDGIRIDTAYRVERRQLLADGLAVDSGYMRQTLRRPDGTAQVRYARFLVTLRRSADGAWRIVADAAMPSTEEVWFGLSAQPGLAFAPGDAVTPPPAAPPSSGAAG